MPFAENTVGAGVIPFPRLTLAQYTSLRAELEVRPSDAILHMYYVLHEPALGALDAHWQKHFAERPEDRAVFERDLATFTAWLRTQPR
jgi:hypothetical protein